MNEDYGNAKTAYKKWFVKTVIFAVLLMIFAVALNITVDPYFHYHRPIIKYRLDNERYINDGIARNFDYDAMIIGNSLSQNFKTSQYDRLFGVKSVKLPYSGAGTMELWQALGRAIGRDETTVDILSYDTKHGTEYIDSYRPCRGYRNSVKEVIVCTDIEDTMRGYAWHRYNDYPDYLYDNSLLNDTAYVLNKDTFYRGTLYDLGLTLLGRDSTTFDDYSAWKRESGPVAACASLDHIEDRKDSDKRQLSDGDMERIYVNIAANMLPVITANPDIEFRLLIPPVSIAKWAERYNNSELEYTLSGYEYILSVLTAYDNVTVYGFDDVYELVTDLDRFCDTIHYDAEVSEWLIGEMSEQRHIITQDNYKDYIAAISGYYCDYDYISLNRYIDAG